jgi:hypothetical protein
MRSAKDGQDGIDCESCSEHLPFVGMLMAYNRFAPFSGEISYKECSTFNDMSGPAMINTFNDINKLVQARKL